MTNKQLNEILDDMAVKASLCNMYKKEGRYKNNFRECPFSSELTGMEHVLKILGIELEYDFNEDCTEILAITARGIRKGVVG